MQSISLLGIIGSSTTSKCERCRWQWWIFRVSGVAFLDGGTVWMQGTPFEKTRFHHAVGIGLRLHILKWLDDGGIIRLDLAYNFDTRRIGIVFSSNQLFRRCAPTRFDYQRFTAVR